MISLEFEANAHLDTKDRYDIITFAMEAADDNGFINSFVFERALFVYAAIILYPERKEDLVEKASSNILQTWQDLVDDDTIKEMFDNYPDDIKVLGEESAAWYSEYADWAHSARGILNTIETLSGDVLNRAATRLQSTAQESGVLEVLQVADE